jgi:hypothetical protein
MQVMERKKLRMEDHQHIPRIAAMPLIFLTDISAVEAGNPYPLVI